MPKSIPPPIECEHMSNRINNSRVRFVTIIPPPRGLGLGRLTPKRKYNIFNNFRVCYFRPTVREVQSPRIHGIESYGKRGKIAFGPCDMIPSLTVEVLFSLWPRSNRGW